MRGISGPWDRHMLNFRKYCQTVFIIIIFFYLSNCFSNRCVTICLPSSSVWEFQLFSILATLGFVGLLNFIHSVLCTVVINYSFHFSMTNEVNIFNVLCYPMVEASLSQQLLWIPLERVCGHAQSLYIWAEVSFPKVKNHWFDFLLGNPAPSSYLV